MIGTRTDVYNRRQAGSLAGVGRLRLGRPRRAAGWNFGRPTGRRAWAALLLGSLLGGPAAVGAAEAGGAGPGEFLISRWETDDGLPENSATAMVQASDGYLWFGTFAGLVRFDGVKFTVFNRSTVPELPADGVVNLHLDGAGHLWVSTLAGMARMKGGRWAAYGPAQGWTGDYVRSFAEGGGRLFASSFNGKIFEMARDRFDELPEPPGMRGRGYRVTVDGAGRLWALQSGYLGVWSGRVWETVGLTFLDGREEVCSGPSRDGGMWIAQSTRLWKLQGGRVTREVPLREPAGPGWTLLEDRAGAVWIASYSSGLTRVLPGGEQQHYTTTNGLSYDALRFTFEDREGNYWVGSSGGGLMRFKSRTFTTLGLASGLPERVVKSISMGAAGEMIAGTYGRGAVRWRDRSWRGVPLGTSSAGDTAYVQCVLADSVGRLWIGTYDQGLFRVQPPEALATRVGEGAGPGVRALFEDSRQRVWIAGNHGVIVAMGDGFEPVPGRGDDAVADVRCFAENPVDGSIWLAGAGHRFFRWRAGRLTTVETAGPIVHAPVNTMLFRRDGALWFGTSGQGLGRLTTGGRVQWIPASAGLTASIIGCLLEDAAGFLWAGSNRGVWRLDGASSDDVANGRSDRLRAQNFTTSDGLASVECTIGFQPSAAKDAAGRLWFATLKGVSVVDPGTLRLNTNPPAVFIERVTYRDRLGRFQELPWTGQATALVPAGSREVGIHYAGLSYTAPEKMRFLYRLEGRGAEWLDATGRRSLYFHTPEPGTIRLRIKAANNDGIWNETGAALALTVQPLLWQTTWFRLLALTTLLAGAGLTTWRLTRNRLRRQIERLEAQRTLAQERARLASVLEATSDFVGFADVQGGVLYVNRAGRRMVGLEDDAGLAPMRVMDFHPAWAAERVLSQGIPAARRDGLWSGETALRHRDGHEIPVSQVVVAHQTPDGDLSFISTIARDITEQKRAEAALRASEECLLACLNNTPNVAVQWFDLQGRVVFWNRASEGAFGWKAAEALGKTLDQLIHTPEEAAGFLKVLEQVHRTGQPVGPVEYAFRRRDGGAGVCLSTTFAIPSPSGDPRFVCMDVDITARKKAEDERRRTEESLRHAQERELRAREEFTRQLMLTQERERQRLANELHDSLGQNLGVIKNRAHLALAQPGVPPGAAAHVEAIQKVVSQAIGEVRSLAQNLRPLHIDQFGLTSSLDSLIDQVAQSTTTRIERRIENVDDVLQGDDATHVYRIAQEALNNMAKHAQARLARVRLERDVRCVRLCIEDDGRGFDAGPARSPACAGPGLGLISIRERARLLGGILRLESEPGRGTRLVAELPVAEAPPPPVSA